MRVSLLAFLLPNTMAMISQTTGCIDKPRILHGSIASTVFAYLSTGGIVKKSVTRLELDWLGLLSPTKSDEAGINVNETQNIKGATEIEDEDTFALRLMQLGGRWWPSEEFCEHHNGRDIAYGHHYPPNLDIGYLPTGEVLVLRTYAGNSPHIEMSDVPAERPNGWSRLGLCRTMEERCDVLRDFGAVLYSSGEECPDVPESLEEGIARGRWYEELMNKMDVWKYVDDWMNSR